MESVLKAPQNITLILDGLDECGKKERKQIISWIARTRFNVSNDFRTLRILVFSQDVEDIRSRLEVAEDLCLSLDELPAHRDELAWYVNRKVGKLDKKFGFSIELGAKIIDTIVESTNGTLLHITPCGLTTKTDWWSDRQFSLCKTALSLSEATRLDQRASDGATLHSARLR
jgi:hypothetical protein